MPGKEVFLLFSNKISMHRFIKKTGFRMEILVKLSSFIIPGVMLLLQYTELKVREIYMMILFREQRDGLKTVVKVLPTLIGLMVAVGVLSESGFMEFLGKWLGKITNPLGFPGELMPVTIVKIFSSSATTGMVLDIFKRYGPDSYLGIVTSLMMSCTETIFYTMSVYYITAKVTKTRWTLPGAILATIAGTIASVILANLM